MEKTMRVDGMTCAHCERAVHDAVASVPGVSGVRVDRAGGQVHFSGTPDLAAIQAAIEEEGYTIP